MDAIIRTPAVSLETRQLKRHPDRERQDTQGDTAKHGKAPTPPAPAAVQPLASNIPAPQSSVNREANETKDATKSATSEPVKELAKEAMTYADTQSVLLQRQKEQDIASAEAERRGYSAGMEKGEEAAKSAVAEQVERLASISSALYRSKLSVLENAEDDIVEIAYSAICRMIGETVTKREVIASMVEQIVSQFRERDQLVVRLNPQDLTLLEQAAAGSDAVIEPQIALRADASIKIGGCIVESLTGALDARLDMQLVRLSETLLFARKNREDVEVGI